MAIGNDINHMIGRYVQCATNIQSYRAGTGKMYKKKPPDCTVPSKFFFDKLVPSKVIMFWNVSGLHRYFEQIRLERERVRELIQ